MKEAFPGTLQSLGHNFSRQTNETMPLTSVKGRPFEVFGYSTICAELKGLETTLQRCTSGFANLQVPAWNPLQFATSFSSLPCSMQERKRQNSISERLPTSWECEMRKLAERIKILENKQRNQGKKVNDLEKENKRIQFHTSVRLTGIYNYAHCNLM